MDHDIPTLRRQLVQLKELHEAGVLPAAQYEEGKAALERRVLDLVMSGAADSPAVAAPSVAPAAPAPVPAAPKPSRGLLASLAVGVLVVAAAGYWWMGSPDQLAVSPAPGAAAGAPAGMQGGAQNPPHATSQEQIADMADKLAERMKGTPEDAEGWAMLGRSYSVLGRHPEALVAYEKAVKLRKDDPNLLADYADSLAVKNGRKLAGEPMKWVEAALKIDPNTPKALALAGTHAFDLKDYAAAVKYWEQLVAVAPADSNFVQQVQSGLAEARQLAGLPAKASDAVAAPATMALPGSAVSGTVSLSPALAKLAGPDDTVFIYARAADGGQRMPLAIQRRQVKDLPIAFTLDDSSSMSPAARISGVKQVIVSARVSKSGQAMPAPGDLTGQTAPVDVGATGLKI
jgi:cytochrome c-type biogenesis protein CcmH